MPETHKYMRQCRYSWCLPLTGFTVTFICGLGLSVSNSDVRTDVQTIGLSLFALWTLLGLYYTVRAVRAFKISAVGSCLLHAIGGGVCTVVCTVYTVRSIEAVSTLHRYAQPLTRETREAFKISTPYAAKLPVWIDTDPTCGQGQTDDVDDCWALAAALRSPELTIRGISTVFGNTTEENAFRLAQQAVQRFGSSSPNPPAPVFSGSRSPGTPAWERTPASEALATALRHERLTIIAQGPLTNIATVMVTHPEVVGQIERIVMIGGKHPGELLHPGTQWWLHFRDFNVCKDTPAVQTVLYSGVPLILMPCALATKVTITRSDLQRLASGDAAAQWLRQVSEPWMTFWEQTLHKEGFHPFDALAIGYLTMPELFTCAIRPARIGFSIFLEPFGMGRDLEVALSIRGPHVYYCFDVEPRFTERFLGRITGEDR
jgi:pyrimidine-specific ribonucleoside hydrolase